MAQQQPELTKPGEDFGKLPISNQLTAIRTTQLAIQSTLGTMQTTLENKFQTMQANIQDIQDAQDDTQSDIQDIHNLFQILDLRSCYRTLNSRINDNLTNIRVFPNIQNFYPQNFPTNISQLRELTGQNIDYFLMFYDLQKTGSDEEKRLRLAENLGITRLDF